MPLNQPKPEQMGKLVLQLYVRPQRKAMLEKIEKVYGQPFADEVKQFVIERYESREFTDFAQSKPLWPVSILANDNVPFVGK